MNILEAGKEADRGAILTHRGRRAMRYPDSPFGCLHWLTTGGNLKEPIMLYREILDGWEIDTPAPEPEPEPDPWVALRIIAEAEPDRVEASEELRAAIDTCKDCLRAKRDQWPPSGLCEKHYGEMSATVWDVNKHNHRFFHHKLQAFARKALGAKDDPTPD